MNLSWFNENEERQSKLIWREQVECDNFPYLKHKKYNNMEIK